MLQEQNNLLIPPFYGNCLLALIFHKCIDCKVAIKSINLKCIVIFKWTLMILGRLLHKGGINLSKVRSARKVARGVKNNSEYVGN